MKFAMVLLLLLFLNYNGYSQHKEKNDLQQRNLFGKISTVKTSSGNINDGYTLDSFDQQGYILKSTVFYSDGDGHNSSTYWTYNNDHHLLMCTYNRNGEVGTVMYNYNERWQLIEEKLDGAIYCTSTKYEYDSRGNCIKKIIIRDLKGEWIKTQNIFLKYNDKNQLIEAISTPSNDDSVEYGSVFYEGCEHFGFASEGYFIGRATLKYNHNDKIIEQDQFDYKGKPDGKIICRYDMYNNIVGYTQYLKMNKTFFTNITYTYDVHNNWITKRYDKDMIQTRAITYY